MAEKNKDMTLKEIQFLIKHIEKGSLKDNLRYNGENIKGTIEEELFDIFYYIIAIANDYNIDLEEIFHIKDKINKEKYERSFSLEEARKEYEKNIE